MLNANGEKIPLCCGRWNEGVSVLHAVTSLSNGLRLWYGLMWATKGGKRSLIYCGQRPSIIFWNIKSLCRFRLSFNVQNPDSMYSFWWLVPRIPPIMLLMASRCRLSSCVFLIECLCSYPRRYQHNQKVGG